MKTILIKYILPPTVAIALSIISYQFYMISILNSKQDELVKENQSLSDDLDRQKQTTQLIESNFKSYQESVKETNESFAKYNENVSSLEEQLSRNDLTKMFNEKPKLMIKIFNNGTREVFDEIRNNSDIQSTIDNRMRDNNENGTN